MDKFIEQKVLLLIFLMLVVVILMNSGISKEFRQHQIRKARLREQRELVIGRKSRRIEKFVTSERALIHATKTGRSAYIAILIASIVIGWLMGKLIFTDTFIAFVVSGMCIIVPHIILLLKGNKDKRNLAENLEAAMRIITHEYLTTGDLQRAIENSIDVIDHSKPFKEFLVDCKMVSSNMERNLRRLENKENNLYFSRWIDQLILTQSDRTQMSNLVPILDDMNDAKTAQRQNETFVASAWRDYFTMLFIILLSPLLVRVVQREWYMYLVTTAIGKGLIIALLAALIWSTLRAMKINQPITG